MSREWRIDGFEKEGEGRTGKCFDLFSDYVDAAVVAGVKLENHLAHVFGAVYASSKS